MYDIIVIGGGPAGSSAAHKASSLGLKTLLIEKEHFPRYKSCAGAVSDSALSYLDFRIPSTILEKEMRGVRIVYRGQKVLKYAPQRIGILVERKVFDDFLLKMAGKSGTKIIMGEKAVHFANVDDKVRVVTDKGEYDAHFLIIAEGAHGNLQYRLKDRPRKNEYAISFVAEIEEDNDIINEHLDNIVEVHTGLLKMGFGWVFPHNGYYSVGIAGIAKYMNNPKNKMREFLDSVGFRDRYQIKGHLIPAGGIKPKLTSSRVVLTGDAAGFVDSFYGEGISYAIRSGQIASETISRIIKQEDSVTMEDYDSLVKDEFEINLKYSLLASKLAHSIPLFFKLGIENESLVNKFIDIALQKTTYKGLLKWIIPRLPWYFLRHFLKKANLWKIQK
jgi:geranylgeranyl reductase family protein